MEVKTRRGKDNSKTRTVVHFTNKVEYTEIAAILIDTLERIYAHSPAMALHYADREPIDPKEFGEQLEMLFDPTDIQELMAVDQGPGILLGMYLAKLELADAEQADEDHI